MAIPNPNPNIADGIKCDNKTYSSNKIESLITTATELPVPEAGDAGKVLTVNPGEDGYELDSLPIIPDLKDAVAFEPVTIASTITVTAGTETDDATGAAVPSKDGYTPIAVIGLRASGYYGARVLCYAWIDSDNIHYSYFNPDTHDATVNLTGIVLYKKS